MKSNNFYEEMESRLLKNGLDKVSTNKIMKIVIESEGSKSMDDRWGDSIEGYDKIFADTIWLGVKLHARKWINENAPNAWFRPAFELANPNKD